MRKSKATKRSSSVSKQARPQVAAGTAPGRRGARPFSIFDFQFAIPSTLRAALRLAACLVLFIQTPAHAGPGSLWKDDSSRSMFADKRAHAVHIKIFA